MPGYFEAFDGAVVSGWGVSRSDINNHAHVRIVLDGNEVCRGVADEFRADLKQAGLGDGKHAFQIKLPFDCVGQADSKLEIFVDDEAVPIDGTPGENGSWLKVEHSVSGGSDGVIEGWVFLPDFPEQKVLVRLKNSALIVGEVLAQNYREDLKLAGKGDGKYLFTAKVPAAELRTPRVDVDFTVGERKFELTTLEIPTPVTASGPEAEENRHGAGPKKSPENDNVGRASGQNISDAKQQSDSRRNTDDDDFVDWKIFYPLPSSLSFAGNWLQTPTYNPEVTPPEVKIIRRNPFVSLGYVSLETVAMTRARCPEAWGTVWIIGGATTMARTVETLLSIVTQSVRPSRVVLVDEDLEHGAGKATLRCVGLGLVTLELYGTEDAIQELSKGRDANLVIAAGAVMRPDALAMCRKLSREVVELPGLICQERKQIRSYRIGIDGSAMGSSRVLSTLGAVGAIFIAKGVKWRSRAKEKIDQEMGALIELWSGLRAAGKLRQGTLQPLYAFPSSMAMVNVARNSFHWSSELEKSPRSLLIISAFTWGELKTTWEMYGAFLGDLVSEIAIISTPGLLEAWRDDRIGVDSQNIQVFPITDQEEVDAAVAAALRGSSASHAFVLNRQFQLAERELRAVKMLWSLDPEICIGLYHEESQTDDFSNCDMSPVTGLWQRCRPAPGDPPVATPFPITRNESVCGTVARLADAFAASATGDDQEFMEILHAPGGSLRMRVRLNVAVPEIPGDNRTPRVISPVMLGDQTMPFAAVISALWDVERRGERAEFQYNESEKNFVVISPNEKPAQKPVVQPVISRENPSVKYLLKILLKNLAS